MAIVCPYCKHSANVKSPKAGKYTPKCPKCARPFSLVVPADASAALIVRPLPEEARAGPAAAEQSSQATGEYSPTVPLPTAARAPAPAAGKPAHAAQAPDASAPAAAVVTGEYQPTVEADETGAHGPAPGTKMGDSEKTRADTERAEPMDMPETLGGYQVLKLLGTGGMGAVYLGRQLSLDRNVALKVMKPQWARKPRFVARFTREAYAAAQLTHHNVVQIYDIGADSDINFFSMEFVQGQTLGELVRKSGKLDAEAAVGYALQAARGLKYGHDLGMIHRDVKPDNLMLNNQGIVKVADLGLVKIPDAPEEAAAPAGKSGRSATAVALIGPSDVTHAGLALGTPSYMAPEQGKDAAHVDARADIYSLGCTLYVLLTGRPPFEGATVWEVLSKHATAPVVPPDVIVKHVPKSVSAILLKMMAKKPEDRYGSMDEVITELEKHLGIQSSGPFTPKEEHANRLEDCVQRFNDSPRARLRPKLALGFLGACAVFMLALLLFRQPLFAGAVLGLAVLTPLCYFIVGGLTRKTQLFLKTREIVFGSRIADWLVWAAGAMLFILILYLFGLLWLWLACCVLAALLALGFHFLIDRQVEAERRGPIEEAEKLFKSIRLQGLEEETLRRFVAKYSGKRWEEFYESLFGYEAKLTAREWNRGDSGKAREKFGAWREPILIWVDAKQRARREAKEKQYLQTVEEKSLKAQGVDAGEAKRKADQMAQALVDTAAEIGAAARPGEAAAERRARMRNLVQTAQKPDAVYGAKSAPRRPGRGFGPARLIPGATARLLVGAVLLAGCGFWVNQNALISSERLKEAAASTLEAKDMAEATKLKEELSRETQPLRLPMLPAGLAARLFNSFNPGAAGLILLAGVFVRGWKKGLIIWIAAAVALFGHVLGIPAVGPVAGHHFSMALGAGLALVGILFVRRQ